VRTRSEFEPQRAHRRQHVAARGAANVHNGRRLAPCGLQVGGRLHVDHDVAPRRQRADKRGEEPRDPSAGGHDEAVCLERAAVVELDGSTGRIDGKRTRLRANFHTALHEPRREIARDAFAQQRAAFAVEPCVAKRGGIEKRIKTRGLVCAQRFIAKADAVESCTEQLGVVAHVLRNAQHAAPGIVRDTQVVPERIPRFECFVDVARVAVGAAVRATDHAVLIAGCAKLVRNRSLLDERDAVAGFRECPGAGEAGNACPENGDLHGCSLLKARASLAVQVETWRERDTECAKRAAQKSTKGGESALRVL
jgi:hypothetical protein